MSRGLHILSVALITAGIVIGADIAVTLAWKEPLSSVYASIEQGRAEDELAELERRFPSTADLEAIAPAADLERRVASLAGLFAREVDEGDPIGRIAIHAIDLDAVVIQGTESASLQRGPGHYPGTAFPGQGRTIAIAGHRTTYLAPFRHIDQVDRGDEITLEMPYGAFVYEVQRHATVDPSQTEITRDVGYERLVLTACHPLYSAAQRWAVFAKLKRISVFDAGEGIWQDP